MKAIIKIEYKDYTLGYVARLNGMADITVRKKGSTKMMIGQIIQMPEEYIRKWFEQLVDGKENESDINS